MRMKLVDALAARGSMFTTSEAQRIWGTGSAVTRVLLSRLAKTGWIERLETGKYMIVPLGAKKGDYTLHEFAVGSVLVRPSAIAYWSALHHHGLTEQIPATVFLQTTARARRGERRILGVNYRIVRVASRKFFGTRRERLDGTDVDITGPEKTVIDCLDKTRYSGGVVEVAKAVMTGKLDAGRLEECALKNGSSAVHRRLGFLCDLAGIGLARPKEMPRNYIPLDPTHPVRGKKDARWRLVVNVDLEMPEGPG